MDTGQGFWSTQYKNEYPQCKQEFYLCFTIDHDSITQIMCNSEEEVAPGPCLCQPGACVPGNTFLLLHQAPPGHISLRSSNKLSQNLVANKTMN